MRISAFLALFFTAIAQGAETQTRITFTGGHDIGKGDFGRPVALIAAALDVKPDVFREAFSGVTPAKNGKPSDDEARSNKAALMEVLVPHGVTNERLDEVSNYYRFRKDKGQSWPTTPAKAIAIVEDGKIKRIEVAEAGAGYCNPPTATVEGMKVELKVHLQFDKDMKKNGAVKSIEVVK
jgi:hypothetical protein